MFRLTIIPDLFSDLSLNVLKYKKYFACIINLHLLKEKVVLLSFIRGFKKLYF